MTCFKVLNINADNFLRSQLHSAEMPWQETNCYLDVWIEIIHTMGFEPEACLGFTVAADFEQDQWTFSKPSFTDLYDLYGLRVEELNIWRSLPSHCEAQLKAGNIVLLEVDSYYLPDTVATDYRSKHTKTTIGVNEIDLHTGFIGYFHNTGYHSLVGADFAGVFRLDRSTPNDYLLPYCEIVKAETDVRAHDVTDILRILSRHVRRRPENDPFASYSVVFAEHIEWIREGGFDTYHDYAFATLRQCGAAFDLAARHLMWLDARDDSDWAEPARSFESISSTCKLILLKLSRVAMGKSPTDFTQRFQEMSAEWNRAFEALNSRLADKQ